MIMIKKLNKELKKKNEEKKKKKDKDRGLGGIVAIMRKLALAVHGDPTRRAGRPACCSKRVGAVRPMSALKRMRDLGPVRARMRTNSKIRNSS